MQRDFTYIDDIVEGVIRIQDVVPTEDTLYKLYNIGNSSLVELEMFISCIENALGKKASKNYIS